MRKWVGIVTAFAVGALVAVPVALAFSGSGKLDTQAYRLRTTPASTSNKSFVAIPGLDETVCAQNEVAATVSGNAQGSGFALLVRVDFDGAMGPGAAYIYPPANGAAASFSVTFLIITAPFEGNDHHEFTVQWRSLTGKPAALQRGLLNLQFENGTHMCP